MPLKTVEIKKIKIGDRFRQDLGDIESLTASIKEKGVIQPITLNKNLELMAGGRRIHAAIAAGLTKIPALIRDTEGEADLREIEILENTMRKDMNWDEQCALVKRISDLYYEKFGHGSQNEVAKALSMTPGWVSQRLKIAEAVESVPELKQMKSADDVTKFLKKAEETMIVEELRRRQDVEIEEKHESDFLKMAASNYRVGDTFDGFAEFSELRERSPGAAQFDLIEVDPPYGIDLNEMKKGDESDELERYTEVDRAEYKNFLERLSKELYASCRPDGWVIFWYGPTHHTVVFESLRGAGFEVDDIPAIWDKGAGQTMSPDLYLARCYEPFAIARRGSPSIRKRGRSNVFRFSLVAPSEKYHPTQRPLDLMREVLSVFGFPGSNVLVPFLGSGVTLRACYAEGINGMGWDLDGKNRDRFLLQVDEDIKNALYDAE